MQSDDVVERLGWTSGLAGSIYSLSSNKSISNSVSQSIHGSQRNQLRNALTLV